MKLKDSLFAPSDLWKRFIDPGDWDSALLNFKDKPWLQYIEPSGSYSAESWEYFQSAYNWVSENAKLSARESIYEIRFQDVLTINSILLTGSEKNWKESLRNYRPIFNQVTGEDVLRIYDRGGCYYKNDDSLVIRVDGFLPAETQSIDFFIACRKLSSISFHQSCNEWIAAYDEFVKNLHACVSTEHRLWNCYYLSKTDELIKQIGDILNWYSLSAREVDRISIDNPARAERVLELAVKTARYIDICQFCLDGSGRTSMLLRDLIFLRFGFLPPEPVPYFAHGRSWQSGTYLSLEEAIDMTSRGFSLQPFVY